MAMKRAAAVKVPDDRTPRTFAAVCSFALSSTPMLTEVRLVLATVHEMRLAYHLDLEDIGAILRTARPRNVR